MRCGHDMRFGAQLEADGARFRLWAPNARRVLLKAHSAAGELQADLSSVGEGWFELSVGGFEAGARYVYCIDDEVDVPDPSSRFNAEGVGRPSVLVDPRAFEWREDDWRGRDWNDAVVYEMHVGCFTREGTYAAAAERLGELAQLGVTAIELMPLAAFPGERGWGYDGVLLYAPHHAYGAPDDLKRFVESAHAHGIEVLLDVVYNHFGPEGNYLSRYAADFFTARHRTPWGDAVNFGHPVVREFFIQNALYWLNEYRLDGLRIDAVHAMHDDGPRHFIDELVDAVEDGPGRDRSIHIVLENERNEASKLTIQRPNRILDMSGSSLPLRERDRERGLAPCADDLGSPSPQPSPVKGEGARAVSVAQWNDDFHHALHVLLTGERDGYYLDYADRPLHRLGRVLAEGFAYQGERSTFSGEHRGEPSAHLPPPAFVSFLQNHDQVGNRAFGERLAHLAERERLRAGVAVLLLSPQIPMIFMGGEYAASQPFLYFCDYQGELAEAVRNGRRAEFGRFGAFADERAREQIPDPNARSTFEASRLEWSERDAEPHAAMLAYVRELLRVRRERIAPLIGQIAPGRARYDVHKSALHVHWPLHDGATLSMHANFGDSQADSKASGEILYSTAAEPSQSVLQSWEARLLLS